MFGVSYWILPIIAGLIWLGMLAGMLGQWLAAGSPKYPWMGEHQTVAYISDIGAGFLQPLFIACSTAMVVIFDFTFISERWLRHKNRLTPNYTRKEAVLSLCAILFALIGAAALIALTILDIRQHQRTHDALLVVFIVAYVISAIFIDAEYQRLGIHFRQYRILRISFWIKMAFIFVEVGLAIGFGVCSYNGRQNIAAYLEWIVALIYIFYVWSFALDFWPARDTKPVDNRFPPLRKRDDPEAARTQQGGNVDGGPVYTNGGQPPMTENGYGNGYTNGYANGNTNGYTNGYHR